MHGFQVRRGGQERTHRRDGGKGEQNTKEGCEEGSEKEEERRGHKRSKQARQSMGAKKGGEEEKKKTDKLRREGDGENKK